MLLLSSPLDGADLHIYNSKTNSILADAGWTGWRAAIWLDVFTICTALNQYYICTMLQMVVEIEVDLLSLSW